MGLLLNVACLNCGRERNIDKAQIKRTKYTGLCADCSLRSRRGDKSPSWKGGRLKTTGGYILIYLYPNDFFYPMASCYGHVLEHRLVMAQHLGRCLQSWEWVHHKDGMKDHNEYANLKMTTNGSHAIEHNKGYKAGFQEGYEDGKRKADQERVRNLLISVGKESKRMDGTIYLVPDYVEYRKALKEVGLE